MIILWVNIQVRPPPSWDSVFGITWLQFSSRLRLRTRNRVGPRPRGPRPDKCKLFLSPCTALTARQAAWNLVQIYTGHVMSWSQSRGILNLNLDQPITKGAYSWPAGWDCHDWVPVSLVSVVSKHGVDLSNAWVVHYNKNCTQCPIW